MRQRIFRFTSVAVVVSGLLAGSLLGGPVGPATAAAQTGPYDFSITGGISGPAAETLATNLGTARIGGLYLNSSGRIVTTVTDKAAAQTVEAAGGIAQLVKYSTDALESVKSTLHADARIPGTSWGVDPSTNQVSVEYDDTVTGAKLAQLKSVAGRFGDAIRVEHIPGELTTELSTSGGDEINNFSGSVTCSLGFNVQNDNGTKFFITAGHCTDATKYWYRNGTLLGERTISQFPGDDFGIVKYTNSNVSAYGTVRYNGVEKQITSSRYAIDEESVYRIGAMTSDYVGKVLLPSTSVNYGNGITVDNVIKTSLCAVKGDSGGSLAHGSVALGILSGGTVGFSDSCRTYYQQLQIVLNGLDLKVY